MYTLYRSIRRGLSSAISYIYYQWQYHAFLLSPNLSFDTGLLTVLTRADGALLSRERNTYRETDFLAGRY